MSETPNDRINKMMQDAIDNNIPAHQRPLLGMGLLKQFGIELAAMTAEKELAERELHNRYLEHVHDLAIERDALKAAKELAERQVAVLAGTLASDVNKYPCGSMAWSADQWAAWSRAEAEGGK